MIKFSGKKRFSDICLLLTHGIFFYFMSYYISAPINFLYFFLLLSFVNIIWLLIQLFYKFFYKREKRPRMNLPEVLMGGMEAYKPLLYWSINNLIFMGLIFAVIFSEIKYKLLIGLLLTILNFFTDFMATWPYYFPNLTAIYEKAKEQEESSLRLKYFTDVSKI